MEQFPVYKRRRHLYPDVECINAFKEKYPQYKNVGTNDFLNIIKSFNQKVTDEAINNRNGVLLPDLLGILFIGKSKTRKRIKSFSKYENNERLAYNNEDTFGYLMKICFTFSASKLPIRNYNCWTFKAIREFRRKAAEIFKKKSEIYVDTTNIKYNGLFEKKKNANIQKHNKVMFYNEIDI